MALAAICALASSKPCCLRATIATLAGTLLLIDPIDPNFMVVAVPVPAPFSPVTAGNGLTQANADALNAQLANESMIVGVLRAIITSDNRASGAHAAGNAFWEQKQVDAINGLMLQLGALLGQEANTREAAVASLRASNTPCRMTWRRDNASTWAL